MKHEKILEGLEERILSECEESKKFNRKTLIEAHKYIKI